MKIRTHQPRRILALLLALLMLGGMSSTALAADTVSVTGTYCQSDARSMLKGLNDFRTSSEAWYWNSDNNTKTTCKNLKKLSYDYTLERIAMLRAAEIVVRWSHTRPNNTNCFTAFEGTNYRSMGENLAMGTSMTRDDALEGLKETYEPYAGQGHRRNMLSDSFTAVGIAHFQCNGIDYWVQEFGSPTLNTSPTPPNDSPATVQVDTSGAAHGGSGGQDNSSGGGLSVSWKRDKKASGYQVQYSTSKKFKKGVKTVKLKGSSSTSTTIQNLKSGKTYYLRYRSFRKKGKKTKYGRWSKTMVYKP